MAGINYSNVSLINETIKDIVRISRKVNMAALNAMFVSRRGGARTIGFATVTTEMRKFSIGLEQQMQRLADSLTQLIYVLSQSKKAEHTAALMDKAIYQSRAYLDQSVNEIVRARINIKLKKIAETIENDTQAVLRQLEKSEDICNVGHSLAVLAKIESQTGGEHEEALMNVSNTIENIIENIDSNLAQAKQYSQTSA